MPESLITDTARYLLFAFFGLGSALMIVTNALAFRVLRPPKKLGFLWWHVTAISFSFLCLGAVTLDTVVRKLGSDYTWRTAVAFAGFLTFLVAQAIIFNVERQRFLASKIRKAVGEACVLRDQEEPEVLALCSVCPFRRECRDVG